MHSEVACRWLEKARRDLAAAERLLDMPDYSAFHAQQAAEKALKALLVALGERPPRTHNIGLLLEKLRGRGLDVDRVTQARILTEYAVEARYPDIEETVEREEADEALGIARRVLEWAAERLRELGVEC